MKREAPLVSIAIPAFRPGELFRQTLRSCIEQRGVRFEVVVAVDGSDEDVLRVVKEVGDARVRVIADGSRHGQYANFNRAVDGCIGEYIKLLCADDLLARDCLSTMVATLEAHREIGLCAAPHVGFWSDASGALRGQLEVPVARERKLWTFGPEEGRWFTARLGNQVGGPSNAMVRKSAWWKVGGFNTRISHVGDQDLWYRLIDHGGLALLSRPLIGYRMHANSVTGRDARSAARIEEPAMIVETATPGAAFPNGRWRERAIRALQTVNSTAGYAAAMARKDVGEGVRGLWALLTSGGMELVPATLPLAAWAVVRGSVLGLRTQWPFADFSVSEVVNWSGTSSEEIVEILSDPQGAARMLSEAVKDR